MRQQSGYARRVEESLLRRAGTVSALYAILLAMLVAGCSQRGWYEGVKQGHRHQCSQVPEAERDECLAQHDESYEEYRQKREGIGE